MQLLQHLWEFVFLCVILLSPIPLCFALICIDNNSKEKPNLPHFLLVLLTSWCFIEISIGLVLGTIKHLDLNAVLFCEFLVFIAGIILLIYLRRHIPFFSFHKLLRLNQPLNKNEILLISSISLIGLILLERLLTLPITDYDSLWFHLPYMARWYQTASFTWFDPANNFVVMDHGHPARYPYNWHVLCTLLIMPFQEDFIVTLPMIISWIILGLSVYLLSVQLEATRIYALATSSLLLTIPLLVNQINTMHIDLPLASFFVASLYFAFSYTETRSLARLFLFLASLGMLMGIKTPGLIYAFLLLAAFIILQAKYSFLNNKQNNRHRFFRNRFFYISFLVSGVGICIFIGGFWYIKNLIEFGNPLGDVGLTVANSTTLSGNLDYAELSNSTLAAQFRITRISHWLTLGLQVVFRLQIPFLVILFLFLVLPGAFLIKHKPIKNEAILYVLALVASTGFLYWNTPASAPHTDQITGELSPLLGYSIRYGFPFIGMLAVGAAMSATVANLHKKILVIVVLFASISGLISSTIFDGIITAKFVGHGIWGARLINAFSSNPGWAIKSIFEMLRQVKLLNVLFVYIVLYLFLIVSIYNGYFLRLNRNPFFAYFFNTLRRAKPKIIISILIGLLFTTTFLAREKRDIKRHQIYSEIYEYMEQNIESNEKIGYFSSRRSYFFYGKKLNQQVVYVDSTSEQSSEWLNELEKQNIKLVAVGPLEKHREPDKEISWLENDDGSFIRVFGQDLTIEPLLYRFQSQENRKSIK